MKIVFQSAFINFVAGQTTQDSSGSGAWPPVETTTAQPETTTQGLI